MMKYLKEMGGLIDRMLTCRTRPTHLSFLMQQQLNHGTSEMSLLITHVLNHTECHYFTLFCWVSYVSMDLG
jgi:hypothetical protein